jgi:cytochrome c oxidase assembly protein subunit 15
MTGVLDRLGTPQVLRRVAFASVVANVVIVITGGAVRLTGSGLGCPTWPGCTEDSYVPTAAMGVHGVIEFGNRLITLIVALVAVLGVVAAWRQRPRRPRVTRLAVAVFLGIPAQGIVGGVTVLTTLNPWVVGCHFLVSMAVIAAAYAFWRATGETDEPALPTVPAPLRALTLLVTATSAAVLVAGTVVTGSGPHAGDENARRTGLDPVTVSQVHADLVVLLIGLVVAAWFALRAVGATAAAVRVAWLFGVILAQGLVGVIQYATGLPAVVVGLHMAGACAVWLATLSLLFATRTRSRTPSGNHSASPGVDHLPPSVDHEPKVMIDAEIAR